MMGTQASHPARRCHLALQRRQYHFANGGSANQSIFMMIPDEFLIDINKFLLTSATSDSALRAGHIRQTQYRYQIQYRSVQIYDWIVSPRARTIATRQHPITSWRQA
jgi:hypothetical protein